MPATFHLYAPHAPVLILNNYFVPIFVVGTTDDTRIHLNSEYSNMPDILCLPPLTPNKLEKVRKYSFYDCDVTMERRSRPLEKIPKCSKK